MKSITRDGNQVSAAETGPPKRALIRGVLGPTIVFRVGLFPSAFSLPSPVLSSHSTPHWTFHHILTIKSSWWRQLLLSAPTGRRVLSAVSTCCNYYASFISSRPNLLPFGFFHPFPSMFCFAMALNEKKPKKSLPLIKAHHTVCRGFICLFFHPDRNAKRIHPFPTTWTE